MRLTYPVRHDSAPIPSYVQRGQPARSDTRSSGPTTRPAPGSVECGGGAQPTIRTEYTVQDRPAQRVAAAVGQILSPDARRWTHLCDWYFHRYPLLGSDIPAQHLPVHARRGGIEVEQGQTGVVREIGGDQNRCGVHVLDVEHGHHLDATVRSPCPLKPALAKLARKRCRTVGGTLTQRFEERLTEHSRRGRNRAERSR